MLHEKLECYQMALVLAEEVNKSIEKWPSGYGYLSDQIKRSLASIVLNCAEGNSRNSIRERQRFFQIARASSAEVSACIDLLFAFQIISPDRKITWKNTLNRISKMLYHLK